MSAQRRRRFGTIDQNRSLIGNLILRYIKFDKQMSSKIGWSKDMKSGIKLRFL